MAHLQSSGLDWNYSDALAEDMHKKQIALDAARRIHHKLLQVSDSPAFQRQHLGKTLCLYHLLFKSNQDAQTEISTLQETHDSYKHLGEDCEPPLWHDADQAVIDQITSIAKSKKVELLLQQLLACVAGSHQTALGRAEIDDFLDDLWASPADKPTP